MHVYVCKYVCVLYFLMLGLRGAIAFALALNLHEYADEGIFTEDNYHYVVTTTLVIVLFTIVFLGGSTLPMLKVRQQLVDYYVVFCCLVAKARIRYQ